MTGPRISHVMIDSRDPERLAAFWSALLSTEIESRFDGGRFVFLAAGAHGPFDEYHHFADVRADAFYGIPKLGLFLWQLVSLPVDRATPVGRVVRERHVLEDRRREQEAVLRHVCDPAAKARQRIAEDVLAVDEDRPRGRVV